MTSMPWRTRPLTTRADRLLVAGNGARGEDHAVARGKRDVGMLVLRRCARAPRAARPGCRCTAPRPCRAAGSRRRRCRGSPARRRDSRSRARPGRCAPWRGRPPRPRGRRRGRRRRPARRRATLEAKVVTATRAGALGDQRLSASPRRRSPRASARRAPRWSKSPISAEAALLAERAQLRLVGRRPDHRGRIELPVAGVQHGADGWCG